MEDEYKLEKWVWTEDDFEQMGWHDCTVYALRFEDDIYLDIDYILKWNDPGFSGMPYTFWMAPATLVFEQPIYFKLDIEVNFINGFEIAGILRQENEKGETIWNIGTQQGNILIGAAKFKQVIRRPPSFQFRQSITSDERGETSFSLTSEKDYKPDSGTLKKKAQEFKQYTLEKQRRTLTSELEQLNRDQLGAKQFLIRKRDIEKKISNIDSVLKGSSFEIS